MATGLESAFDQQEDDLPYMEVPTEDVVFQTPEAGQYDRFGGRLVSGDTEEYERATVYNEMLRRGLDVQTAQDWFDSGDTTNNAYTLIADNFLEQQDNFVSSLNTLKEEGNLGQFKQSYNEADFSGRAAYLLDQYENEKISKEDYESAWRNEYNLNEKKTGGNRFLFEIKAPRGSDKIDSIYRDPNASDYEAGDNILVVGNPEDPETFGVAFEDIYYPKTANSIQQLQYFDRMGVANEPIPDSSEWVQFRDQFIIPGARLIANVATGGQSEALFSGIKLASGETLKSEDWANLASFGMDKFNIGTDLTQAAVTSAITGDPTDLILEAGGAEAVTDALGKAGVPQELLDDPDFMSGVEEAIGTVAGGGNIQDALESGLTEYVKEGGGFGIELPDAPNIDIDLGAIGDVVSSIASGVRDVGSQIGDVTDPLLSTIGDVGSQIGDVTDPVLSTIGDVGSATEDVVREVGSGIADAAEPFKEPLETIGRGIDDYLLQPVKDALLTGGGALVAQPSGTRTTDGLFSSELFKFSPVEFTDVGRTQPRQAPQELVEDIDSNPFASDFDNRNLFG